MDCSKYGLDVCLPHWTAGNSICNNDFQVRFGIDNGDTGVILAQTAGLQTGTVPYAVGEATGPFNGSCTQRPDLAPSSCALWIGKTDWATCLVHKVRPGGFGCACALDPARPTAAAHCAGRGVARLRARAAGGPSGLLLSPGGLGRGLWVHLV